MRANGIAHLVERTLVAYDGSHDIEHARRVAQNAAHIASDRKWASLAVLAGYAHDVCDAKYNGERRIGALRRACESDGMEPCDVECIVCVVTAISYTRLRSMGPPVDMDDRTFAVWKCVAQADMLEAMGVTGMIRTLMYQGHVQSNMRAALDYAESSLCACISYLEDTRAADEGAKRLDSMRVWIEAARVPSSRMEALSSAIMTRGRRGSPFAAALRLLLLADASDPVIVRLRSDEQRERDWTQCAPVLSVPTCTP